MLFRRSALAFFCSLACLVITPSAQAGPPPWSDAPYSYYAQNVPLHKVLGEFASSFSLSLEISSQLPGQINGRFNARNPTEFLDRMAGVYGFSWFTHAGTLFVSRSSEMSTASISAAGTSIGGMRQALSSLGVLDNRFGWGELSEQGIALVSGPPAYVALVQRTVASLPLVAGGQRVAVFKLKHATVDDRTIQYRDRQITTLGLAQVLRNLVTGNGAGNGMVNASLTALAAPLQTPSLNTAATIAPVVGATADGSTTISTTGGPGSAANAATTTPSGPVAQAARRPPPSIQADSRLNALIVQDTPDRLPIYKQLIEELDVPTALIEIEALIIDVNSTRLDELGIAWGGRKGGTTAGFGDVTAANNSITLSAASRTANINPTTMVVSAGNYLVSRIRALEGQGEATIQSRPSILTVDHTGALLDLSETFYIRTTGERVATVTPITVGTTLKVTPHYIEREGMDAVVQLDVDIEDGQIQDRQIDNLPTIRRSVVSTQAIVGENQTLLVGGYNTQQSTRQTNRVPGLGSVPLVGLLFSDKTENLQTRERLFLIKPRLVTLPSAHSGATVANQNVTRIAVPPGRDKTTSTDALERQSPPTTLDAPLINPPPEPPGLPSLPTAP